MGISKSSTNGSLTSSVHTQYLDSNFILIHIHSSMLWSLEPSSTKTTPNKKTKYPLKMFTYFIYYEWSSLRLVHLNHSKKI